MNKIFDVKKNGYKPLQMTTQQLRGQKYCHDCDKVITTYWELWSCDKNPQGLTTPPMDHGNMIDDCSTCEDEYCNPCDGEIEKDMITKDYIKTHEVNERCCECDQIMESMS